MIKKVPLGLEPFRGVLSGMSPMEFQLQQQAARLDKLEKWQQAALQQSAENSEKLKDLQTDTAQIISFFDTVGGGIRLFAALGRVLKWFTGILVFAAAVVGVYRTVKTGGIPPIKFD